jgi:hypothetical protein
MGQLGKSLAMDFDLMMPLALSLNQNRKASKGPRSNSE